jgi:hypothetical protein
MRLLRMTAVAGAGALLLASAAPTRDAATRAIPTVTMGSGNLVVFKGTTVQCLTFGPIARIPGKRGLLCFVGRPKTHATGTYWIVWTPTDDYYGKSGTSPVFRAVTSATTIHSTVTTTGTEGTVLRLRGTEIGCVFATSRAVDPGHKTAFCTDFDPQGRPYPESDGFAMSDRYLAFTSYDSSRRLHVEERLRQPR